MKNSLLLSIILTLWAAPSLAYEDSDAILIGSGDELPDPDYPVYEESCDEQRLRDPSMSDEEYATFLFYFQETDCAYTFKLGDTGFGGGTVFYVTDEGRHGMEYAPFELEKAAWGCEGRKIQGTEEKGIGFGWQNTQYLRKAGCSPMVKQLDKINYNGYTDWFIGSIDEMSLFIKSIEVPKFEGDLSFYWSSSQHDDPYWNDYGINAYVVHFFRPSYLYHSVKGRQVKTVPFRNF